jgi:hypothetical protein
MLFSPSSHYFLSLFLIPNFVKHCHSINKFVPMSEHHTMKRTGDVKGKLHASVTWALYRGKRSTAHFWLFISDERYHGSPYLGGWKDLRASLGVMAKKGPIQSRESHTDRPDTFRKTINVTQATIFMFILSCD